MENFLLGWLISTQRKLFILSESYRSLLKDKTEITDNRLQKNSLGEALNMQLPSKERILIMKVEH